MLELPTCGICHSKIDYLIAFTWNKGQKLPWGGGKINGRVELRTPEIQDGTESRQV